MNNDIQPYVSVSVTVYNHALYIKACLDGILMQQTSFPFEILLGEDNSTDASRSICETYAKQHPNKIRLFLHDRSTVIKINGHPTGRYNLLNNLKQSKGKYVAHCDGDDYWTDPLKLQKMVDIMDQDENIGLCMHQSQAIKDGELKEIKGFGNTDRFVDFEEMSTAFRSAASCMMFRTKALNLSAKWLTQVFAFDWAAAVITTSSYKSYSISEVMSHYRIHSNSVMRSRSKVNLIQSGMNMVKIIKQDVSPKHQSILTTVIRNDYRRLANAYFKTPKTYFKGVKAWIYSKIYN